MSPQKQDVGPSSKSKLIHRVVPRLLRFGFEHKDQEASDAVENLVDAERTTVDTDPRIFETGLASFRVLFSVEGSVPHDEAFGDILFHAFPDEGFGLTEHGMVLSDYVVNFALEGFGVGGQVKDSFAEVVEEHFFDQKGFVGGGWLDEQRVKLAIMAM